MIATQLRDAENEEVAEAGPAELERLRAALDVIDAGVVELIARRWRVAHQIGAAKRAAGLPLADLEREAGVVRRAAELARSLGVPSEEIRQIFWSLIGLSRRAQSGVR